MNIAFIGNQGGKNVLDFYESMAKSLYEERYVAQCFFLPWLDSERNDLVTKGWRESQVLTFESWVQSHPYKLDEVSRLCNEYADVNWSAVIASERAFTDYSLLLGGAGQRLEASTYVMQLLVNIVTFLEYAIKTHKLQAVVCQTADTLFSHVVFKVAKHLDVRVFAITPAWLLEKGKQGGYFSNNEFMESDEMAKQYCSALKRDLSEEDILRIDSFIDSVKSFQNKTSFIEKNRERNAGLTALSPNIRHLLRYLVTNSRRNSNVEYMKISPVRKTKANLLRVWRKFFGRKMYGPPSCDLLPKKSVFFALQYQPEQSTLTQGIFYANQIALVEDISKSLPMGYTLIVKEHPWGRGARPVWQYKHLAELHNVQFCDAPSKEIICRVDAVIAISGTVGFESLVFEKPTVILGRTFFTHCNLFFKARCVNELPQILREILVDRVFDGIPDREAHLGRFLLSYMNSLIPYFPTIENGRFYGIALADQLGIPKEGVI